MPLTGSENRTRLVILRGNSASGKSSAAAEIRRLHGARDLAVVGQDVLRRDVLREHDVPGGANIGLVDTVIRYALDHGFSVIAEGIFRSDHYGDMLTALRADHRGVTRCYYLDVPFEETLRRHATKPQALKYGRAEMERWYKERDLLPGGIETIIPAASTLEQTARRIMEDTGISPVPPAHPDRAVQRGPGAAQPAQADLWECAARLRGHYATIPPAPQLQKTAAEAEAACTGMPGLNSPKDVRATQEEQLAELGNVLIAAAVAMITVTGDAGTAGSSFGKHLASVMTRARLETAPQ